MIRSFVDRHASSILLGTLSILFVVVVFWSRIVISIPSGSVGVLWLRFFGGTVPSFYFGTGTKIIAPWDRVYIYDARLRRLSEEVRAITQDGLSVSIGVTVIYRLEKSFVAQFHEAVGPQFESTFLRPVIAAQVRNAISQFPSDGLYRANTDTLDRSVADGIGRVLVSEQNNFGNDRSMIAVTRVFIGPIDLPATVQEQIEAKLAEQQQAQQAEFAVARERLESQRKEIEAEGIRKFQDIVSSGISENYLRWKGIDATLQLSKSTNSKVIVIGGANGLPLILDGSDRSGPSQEAHVNPEVRLDPENGASTMPTSGVTVPYGPALPKPVIPARPPGPAAR